MRPVVLLLVLLFEGVGRGYQTCVHQFLGVWRLDGM